MYTKGKWTIEKELNAYHIKGESGIDIATVFECKKQAERANAERICFCVNSHDELVKQRDELLEACRDALLIRSKMYAVQYHSGSSFDFKIYLLEVDLENEVIEIDKRIREAIATAEKQGS